MCRANNIIHSLVMELKPRPAALVLVPTAQTVNQFIIRVKTGSSTINTCKLCVICSLGRMPKFKDHSTEGATWEFCAYKENCKSMAKINALDISSREEDGN